MEATSSSRSRARLRTLIAVFAGLAFVLAYVVVAVTIPDRFPHQHWAAQALYWCLAGVLWVFPVWGLMLFAAGTGAATHASSAAGSIGSHEAR